METQEEKTELCGKRDVMGTLAWGGRRIIRTVLRVTEGDTERQGGPWAEEESCHKTAPSAAK